MKVWDGIKLIEQASCTWSEMMHYLIVIEKTETEYSAYSPDLPGCVSTGEIRKAVEQNMGEAIVFHLDGLKMEGLEIPPPTALYAYVDI